MASKEEALDRIKTRSEKIAGVTEKIERHSRTLRNVSRKRNYYRGLVDKWNQENVADQKLVDGSPDAV